MGVLPILAGIFSFGMAIWYASGPDNIANVLHWSRIFSGVGVGFFIGCGFAMILQARYVRILAALKGEIPQRDS
jgi:hypothetical protein